jgi:hypothetical protein
MTARHLCILVAGSVAAACGSPEIKNLPDDPAAGGGSSSPGGAGPSGSGSGSPPGDFRLTPNGPAPGSSAPGGGASSPGNPDGVRACVETKAETTRLPVDLYIVQDRSGSMGMQGKWEAVKNALITFVQSPDTSGMHVGLGFFPRQGSGAACMACTTIPCFQMCGCSSVQCTNGVCRCTAFAASCSGQDYVDAAVGIEPLPGVAPKIVMALNGVMTTGGTPTRPALEGGVQFAKAWLASKNRRVALALATDGEPTGCTDNNVTTVADVARRALADGIHTFVIGVGPNLNNLNAMAMGGGTGKAFLIEGGNIQQQFLETLRTIQGQASRLSCSYAIPPPPMGQALDPRKVNVRFTSGEPPRSVYIGQVEDRGKCGPQGGWYYDNPTMPRSITLCDSTCTMVNQGGEKAEVAVLFGCATRVVL